MKNSFKVISLIFSAGFPATLVAEFFGARLPVMVDPSHMFNASVIALTLQVFATDYAQPVRPMVLARPTRHPIARVDQPSRACDNLRLAA
jgi:hypothetical protein